VQLILSDTLSLDIAERLLVSRSVPLAIHMYANTIKEQKKTDVVHDTYVGQMLFIVGNVVEGGDLGNVIVKQNNCLCICSTADTCALYSRATINHTFQ
jgi:hypothetical protein